MKEDIEEIKAELRRIQEHLEQVPLDSGGGGETVTIYEVVDGQTLTPASQLGIKYQSSPVSVVDSDPNTGGTRPDGLGRARNVVTGEYILVVHDSDGGYGTQIALRAGDYGISIKTKTSSGGSVYHYLARF